MEKSLVLCKQGAEVQARLPSTRTPKAIPQKAVLWITNRSDFFRSRGVRVRLHGRAAMATLRRRRRFTNDEFGSDGKVFGIVFKALDALQ